MRGDTEVSTPMERNRTYRKRKQQLQQVREELTHMLEMVDPRYARELIPSKDVRAMFRKLLDLATVEGGQ